MGRIATKQISIKRILLLGIPLLAFSMLISLGTGSAGGNLWVTLKDYLAGERTVAGNILFYIRLPRTMAAALAGAALAVSGAMIQTALDNPLASPNIIGVNSGAGLFAMICFAFFPANTHLLPVFAFSGAVLTTLLIYGFARLTGASRATIILAGVAMNSLLNAITDAVSTLLPSTLVAGSSFKIGTLNGVKGSAVSAAAWYIIPALIVAVLLASEADVLSLGDEAAHSLGMNTRLIRFLLLSCAGVLAGAAVSFAGLIGFIGLIVPHCIRFFTGGENKLLYPACILFGASFLILCDMAARTIFAPYELPVGILMSFFGAPFLIWLTVRRHGGRTHA